MLVVLLVISMLFNEFLVSVKWMILLCLLVCYCFGVMFSSFGVFL